MPCSIEIGVQMKTSVCLAILYVHVPVFGKAADNWLDQDDQYGDERWSWTWLRIRLSVQILSTSTSEMAQLTSVSFCSRISTFAFSLSCRLIVPHLLLLDLNARTQPFSPQKKWLRREGQRASSIAISL